MSKREKIAKIKEIIRRLVVRELEEASTTASAGAANPMGTGIYYDTPYAFRSKKKKDKEKLKKITRAGGYKPVKENMELKKLEDAILMFQKKIKKQGRVTNARDEDHLKNLIKVYKQMGGRKIKESVNESQPFADFPKLPKLSRAQQESLDELFGFAESYQIFNSFNSNPKKFIQTLDDMAKIRKASNKQPKGVNFNKGKKEFVKEGRYHDWRNDESLTPKQKIGKSMREIRDALNELDKTVKMNLKLKTELKMKSEDYWKNTHKALTKISERLVKMANKVGNLK